MPSSLKPNIITIKGSDIDKQQSAIDTKGSDFPRKAGTGTTTF